MIDTRGTLVSVQVGKPQTHADEDGEWTTGFFKQQVARPTRADASGLEGDGQADTKHHGGIDKAVLAYAADHYPAWTEQLERELPFGGFGENLTLAGIDEKTVCIGDQWQIGDVVFEVSQPRQPCWKLGRRWSDNRLPKLVLQSGRSGWYLRVVCDGNVEAGQIATLRSRSNPDWSVSRANEVFYGTDAEQKKLLANLKELAASWKESLS